LEIWREGEGNIILEHYKKGKEKGLGSGSVPKLRHRAPKAAIYWTIKRNESNRGGRVKQG